MDTLRGTVLICVITCAAATPAFAATATAKRHPRPQRAATALPRLGPAALTALARDLEGARLEPDSPLGTAALRLPATADGRALRLPGDLPWSRARFLVADALADGQHSGELLLRFFARGEDEPRIRVSLGLFPGLPTRITLPLSALDAQAIFLPRTPGRLKGVVSGRRLPLAEIDRAELQLRLTAAPQSLYLGGVWLSATEPPYALPAKPLVDALGQWAAKEWPGKTKDEQELRDALASSLAEARAARFPESWCRFGGTRSRMFEATGFFRTQHDGARWWLVDPEGHGFFSVGLDSVHPGERAGVVAGAEALFGALPGRSGPFAEAWGGRSPRWRTESFSFGIANLVRAFGADWRARWTELMQGRLRAWRFNTVANWSDPEFQRAAPAVPYVIPMPEFPTTARLLYRDFPDVYADEFRASARRWAQALLPFRGDPSFIGYFMRNEPNWAFAADNLAAEMLETNPGTATRRALAAWLRDRYEGDAAAWAKAWGLGLAAFADLHTRIVSRAADRSPAAREDLWAFSKEMVRTYVGVPAAECRRVDPRHLNLGMRYASISSELLYEAADSFDVFTLNSYSMEPPRELVAQIAARTRRPVMIGEFHFGALDRGLPSTGLRAVASQEQRGVAYRHYVELAAANPDVVGAHYFILNDQEVLGRFDGENFQIGFVDVCQRPYQPLVDAAAKAHEAIYAIMQGESAPFAGMAEETSRVGF